MTTTFDLSIRPQSRLRAAIDLHYREAEPAAVARAWHDAAATPAFIEAVQDDARALIREVRAKRTRSSGVDALMREFALSSDEGVALMCLAEALLRIPDAATRDALIRDKIGGGDWHAHVGRSPSLFVNAASWGLLVTGRLVATHSSSGLSAALTRLVARGGEPLIRKGVDLAMRMLGRQFVTGETIAEALANGAPHVARGYRYSFDMLGEAAVTGADAERYYNAYEDAIHAIGRYSAALELARPDPVRLGPGISIKLSALHPRYCRAQRERVMAELLPRLAALARLARSYRIGLNIDAEESERLDLSLDLLEALANDATLDGWDGLGFVVQAYQKRAPFVLDFLIDLARRTQKDGRRLMVRLVKGAYWDSEIKRAQVEGQTDYPVFTRKVHTDVAYQACARRLLDAIDCIYPQFATHNAYSLAWIRAWARASGIATDRYEFQCLHGMGETLYDQIVGTPGNEGLACRIYAPVGSHETLLAYLVRRLLENGANSSFVNRIVDESISIDELVADPVALARSTAGSPHPAIPLPGALYADGRVNSRGFDWSSEPELARLAEELAPFAAQRWTAAPTFPGPAAGATAGAAAGATEAITNPACRDDVVGEVRHATAAEVDDALARACAAAGAWRALGAPARRALLQSCGAALEEHRVELMALLCREAGKSLGNALGEVREAIDFCRYYAGQLDEDASSQTADAAAAHQADARVGKTNIAKPAATAPIVCISPWNFPLAIFVGQLAAALAAGRVVIAKPAEQTPLVAARAVALFHGAGVPAEVLQLLPGDGPSVGAPLVAHAAIGGVLFTGSTEVARSIARAMAEHADERVLIAETGGQNAMIVDSSALLEQVTADVVASAFDSAGQRCSALRVLCLQEEIASAALAMIKGALAELSIGVPTRLSVDVGPVIDRAAQDHLERYLERMAARGHAVTRLDLPGETRDGHFVAPAVVEIGSFGELEGEVFGPVLHVLRFAQGDLDGLLEAINATGFGLTLGIHSRIDEHIERVISRGRAGNVYVNRNMIGAVVGVQPFGGEGLSGTGPKAGGPLYLARLGGPLGTELRRPVATQGAPILLRRYAALVKDAAALEPARRERIARFVETLSAPCLADRQLELCGPTGERNLLWFSPRPRVACVAADRELLLMAVGLVLAAGATALVGAGALPAAFSDALTDRLAPLAEDDAPDAVLVERGSAAERYWRRHVAAMEGPIVPVLAIDVDHALDVLPWLFHERTVSTNTAAAGGNASLMSLGA